MADQQQPESAFGAQLGQQFHDRFGGLRIQRRGDLVAQQDIWLGGDGARDGHALPLPAGQLVWVPLGEVRRQPNLSQQLGNPARSVGFRRPLVQQQLASEGGADPLAGVERAERILRYQLDTAALFSRSPAASEVQRRTGEFEPAGGRMV